MYLTDGNYPDDLPSNEAVKRRNFRKRANDFVVLEDRLYHKNKKDGSKNKSMCFKYVTL